MNNKLFWCMFLLLITLIPVTVKAQVVSNPFTDPNYNQTSPISLLGGEKTVDYEYEYNPCGTLMTEFATPGSVSVGRGPVYGLASQECAKVYPTYIPDDASFRTYSCKNVSFQQSGPIFAHATFAFQCIMPSATSAVTNPTIPMVYPIPTPPSTSTTPYITPITFTTPVAQMTQAQKQALIVQILELIQQLTAMLKSGNF